MSYNVARIARGKSIFDRILGNADEADTLEAENEMMRLSIPQNWNVFIKGNAELKMSNGFEEFMFLVSEHTKEDLDKISLLRFYSLLDYIKSKNTNG